MGYSDPFIAWSPIARDQGHMALPRRLTCENEQLPGWRFTCSQPRPRLLNVPHHSLEPRTHNARILVKP